MSHAHVYSLPAFDFDEMYELIMLRDAAPESIQCGDDFDDDIDDSLHNIFGQHNTIDEFDTVQFEENNGALSVVITFNGQTNEYPIRRL